MVPLMFTVGEEGGGCRFAETSSEGEATRTRAYDYYIADEYIFVWHYVYQ